MASSRQARPAGRKAAAPIGRKAATGVVKGGHKRKVVKKPSAVKASATDRKEPYPTSRTRK